MTPKEKAKELVERYDSTLTYLESKAKAKECALIVVDEIIKDQNGDDSTIGNKTWWWKEVKQEIINL